MGKNKSRQTSLSFDQQTGRWCAKLGRKILNSGKSDGHKFRFTSDDRESNRRKQRIQELWDSLVTTRGAEAAWDEISLEIAKSIADGNSQFVVRRRVIDHREGVPVYEAADQYARYVQGLAAIFPFVSMVPEDADFFSRGSRFETESIDNQISQIVEGAKLFHRIPANSVNIHSQIEPTVRKGLDAYENYIRETMQIDPDLEEGIEGKRLSDTGQSYLKQLGLIREHNSKQLDWPQSNLTLQGCDAMLQVWRDRPSKKRGIGPMAVKTCREHGKRLMAFFRWLSRSDAFSWKKPLDFDELKLSIKRTNRETSAKLTGQQVSTFSEDELRILNEYATAFERFIFLCGLNLGFKRMECATLRARELFLHQSYPDAKYINFQSKDDDSFVRRLRTKTEVFGAWILWPLTVQAMDWVLRLRRKRTQLSGGTADGRQIPFNSDSLLLLNERGYSFTKPTKSGNPNHQISNAWKRLLDRVCKDHPQFRRLPHEALRDTSANWIREKFGGEIAEIFLAHGEPLGTKSLLECYTNRPWRKVFEALRWLEEVKVAAMLKATPADPFSDEHQRFGGLTLKQQKAIAGLIAKGTNVAEIAAEVGCSKMTVYRYQKKTGADNLDAKIVHKDDLAK